MRWSIELILQHVRANFYQRLEAKTGWGKNELKVEFERAAGDALAHFLDISIKEGRQVLSLLKKRGLPEEPLEDV